MILARCPHCATTFRAAPEALKTHAGKVRCGQCNKVFNALDNLVLAAAGNAAIAPTEAPTPAAFAPPEAIPPAIANPVAAVAADETANHVPPVEPIAEAIAEPAESGAGSAGSVDQPAGEAATDSSFEPALEPAAEIAAEIAADSFATVEEFSPPAAVAPDHGLADVVITEAAPAVTIEQFAPAAPDATEKREAALSEEPPDEAAEDVPADAVSTDETDHTPPALDALVEAQHAGLAASRDIRDVPGYSKWAEGALSAPAAAFAEPRKTGWLLVVLGLVLSLMLLLQATHYWRMEIAMRWPDSRPWLEEACASAGCTVPYPRDAGQINLEASELQIDAARNNMLALNLTIKNKADFPQTYPALELTLTDARDDVVARRILPPADWLPPKIDGKAPPPAFAAGQEIAARLWIDASGTGAVGYRLFVFYP